MYIQVVFPIASFTSFTYKVPTSLQSNIDIGYPVNAPFRNKILIGYITSISNKSSFKGTIHSIDSLYKGEAAISSELWRVIIWMSNYYVSPIGLCI